MDSQALIYELSEQIKMLTEMVRNGNEEITTLRNEMKGAIQFFNSPKETPVVKLTGKQLIAKKIEEKQRLLELKSMERIKAVNR